MPRRTTPRLPLPAASTSYLAARVLLRYPYYRLSPSCRMVVPACAATTYCCVARTTSGMTPRRTAHNALCFLSPRTACRRTAAHNLTERPYYSALNNSGYWDASLACWRFLRGGGPPYRRTGGATYLQRVFRADYARWQHRRLNMGGRIFERPLIADAVRNTVAVTYATARGYSSRPSRDKSVDVCRHSFALVLHRKTFLRVTCGTILPSVAYPRYVNEYQSQPHTRPARSAAFLCQRARSALSTCCAHSFCDIRCRACCA